MKCTELKRYLEPFLDGELDAEANLKVLEHLNLCGECNRTFDCEKTLRAKLREQYCGATCAPPELRDRCLKALDTADGPRRWRRLAWVPLAAAVIFAVVLLRPAGSPTESSFAAMAATFHDQNRQSCAGPST